MVSEMRARVRNLEQKIHTRVPRLRMASITGRSTVSPMTPITGASSSSSAASQTSSTKTSWDLQRKSVESRQSNHSGSDRSSKRDAGDSSGWVLIMEDSPSPQKDVKRLKEKRRTSVPNAPTAFRPSASATTRPTSPSLSTGPISPLAISTGLRRPQSRISGASSSTSAAPRPQTPTFLPIPSASLYTSTSSSTTVGMKRSTGPGQPNPYSNQLKRSSFGKTQPVPVPPLPQPRERPLTMPSAGYSTRTSSGNSSPHSESKFKALPGLPDDLLSNVTIRPSSRLPSSSSGFSSSSVLSKSRIGRPSGGGISSSRKSGGGDMNGISNVLDLKDLEPRS